MPDLTTTYHNSFLKFETDAAGDDRAELILPYRDTFQRQEGTGEIHGGVTAAMLAAAGREAAITAAGGKQLRLANFRIDYLSMAVNCELAFRAEIRRAGRTVIAVDIEARTPETKLIALGRATYDVG